MSTAPFAAPAERLAARALPPWWMLLATGVSWTIVGFILLRFDYTSVYSISLLFGFVALSAGFIEVWMTFLAAGWWRLLNALLSVAYVTAGIVAFIHPGDTFVALAAVFSFFLLFAGTSDIIQSISARGEIEVWWLQLIGGIAEVLLGFWAAGNWDVSAVFLVAWVAAFAVIRGVRDIVYAFRLRDLQHAPKM